MAQEATLDPTSNEAVSAKQTLRTVITLLAGNHFQISFPCEHV